MRFIVPRTTGVGYLKSALNASIFLDATIYFLVHTGNLRRLNQ